MRHTGKSDTVASRTEKQMHQFSAEFAPMVAFGGENSLEMVIGTLFCCATIYYRWLQHFVFVRCIYGPRWAHSERLLWPDLMWSVLSAWTMNQRACVCVCMQTQEIEWKTISQCCWNNWMSKWIVFYVADDNFYNGNQNNNWCEAAGVANNSDFVSQPATPIQLQFCAIENLFHLISNHGLRGRVCIKWLTIGQLRICVSSLRSSYFERTICGHFCVAPQYTHIRCERSPFIIRDASNSIRLCSKTNSNKRHIESNAIYCDSGINFVFDSSCSIGERAEKCSTSFLFNWIYAFSWMIYGLAHYEYTNERWPGDSPPLYLTLRAIIFAHALAISQCSSQLFYNIEYYGFNQPQIMLVAFVSCRCTSQANTQRGRIGDDAERRT